MTSLCSVISQGFPGVPGSSGPKVSVRMLGEGYGGGAAQSRGIFPPVVLLLRVTVGRPDPEGSR